MLLSTGTAPILLMIGPTGSGKTTTLYAALRRLAKPGDLHLVSIEDPVEKPVAGVTQIKVDARQERVSFEKALRSVLRHDPDVVMVGEIRDGETAQTALRSALTGHLVLTTLHTNSAPGILTRLVDLGVPPYLVASTLRLAVAQRLLRRPCRECMTWEPADAATCEKYGWDAANPPKVPVAHGCAYCGNTGYSGRTAIYEMLPVNDDVRQMLLKGESEGDIYRWLKATAPELTLRGDGIELARQLREKDIECEYADAEYLVMMVSPENGEDDFRRLEAALQTPIACAPAEPFDWQPAQRRMTVRQAVFAPSEWVDVREAVGRVCASPTVSCPPAIPIAVSGEEITPETARLLSRYGISRVMVTAR